MGEKLRALLVEDNPIILESLQGMLEEMAAVEVVGTAANQADACDWMDTRTQACDVAIVDLFLERGTGLGVLEHMNSYERPPERIVLTNYATDAVRERCEKLGATQVFDKSTEIDKLVEWLGTRVRH